MTVGECKLWDGFGELIEKLEWNARDRLGTRPKKKVQRLIKKEELHVKKLWKLMFAEMECYLEDYGGGKGGGNKI